MSEGEEEEEINAEFYKIKNNKIVLASLCKDDNNVDILATRIDGKLWFKCRDLFEALGYARASSSMKSYVRYEDIMKFGDMPQDCRDSIKTNKITHFINEQGVIDFILKSEDPRLSKMIDWIKYVYKPAVLYGKYRYETI